MKRIRREEVLDITGRLMAGAAFVTIDWYALSLIRGLDPSEQTAIARWLLTAAIVTPGLLLMFRDAFPRVVRKLAFVFAMWAAFRGVSAFLEAMRSTRTTDTAELYGLATYGGTALLAGFILFKLRHVLLRDRTAS